MHGMNPMNQAGPQLKQCPQHIEKLTCAFIDGDWASKAAREEMLQDFYGAMAKDAKDVMSLIRRTWGAFWKGLGGEPCGAGEEDTRYREACNGPYSYLRSP